jgi:HAD superfamily hydrolase (TIGR01509 family)
MRHIMPPPFRAVIFDLDGVLADSEPWWNQIDAKLLAEHGVSYRGEYHRNVLGVSYRLAVEFYKNAFHISASVNELMRRRGEIATEFFANRVGLFPSAKMTLEQLREMKLPLAVATSSVSASARPFLDRTGITSFFDVIVTGDEVQRGKPHPDIYMQTAKTLGISPEICLVIEDALAGVAAAKAANMRVAAIPDTRFVDPREYENEADYVLGSLSEIPALIRRVNAQGTEEYTLR